MQLNVREAARLLNLPESTLRRWARQGKLPASKIHDQYCFNRTELLEWATAQRISVSPELFREPDQGDAPAATLAGALRAGGIHDRLAGSDKLAALEAVVGLMPLPEGVDRQFLLQLLLSRESLASTGLGNGIAVPHVRNPIVMHVPQPLITLCFLQRPIEFGALDGQPVHTLFTIISPTIRAHLNLLAKLAFALRQPKFVEAVARRVPADILRQAEVAEHVIPQAGQGP
jgi:PTS system nitrogen regulatory IIA component